MATLNITQKIDSLMSRRKNWENDVFKKSNEILYQLLDDCLELFKAVQGKPKLCKALNRDLKDRGVPFNAGTSLATRIVRGVFGKNCEQRAFAYARVISIAAEDKDDSLSMSEYIVANGGVEEIRRKIEKGKSPAEIREKRQELAMKEFETSQAIASSIKVTNSKRKKNDAAEHVLFVGIMREEPNGDYSMVFETNAISVINSALTEAGKELESA